MDKALTTLLSRFEKWRDTPQSPTLDKPAYRAPRRNGPTPGGLWLDAADTAWSEVSAHTLCQGSQGSHTYALDTEESAMDKALTTLLSHFEKWRDTPQSPTLDKPAYRAPRRNGPTPGGLWLDTADTAWSEVSAHTRGAEV